jgi:hypothetical protein
MLEIYVKLILDGADGVPMLTVAKEIETALAGTSVEMLDEEGSRVSVVIDEAVVGDFDVYVPGPEEEE